MFNPNQITEYKSGNTPATGTLVLGSIFEAEFNRIYENFLHISKSALYISTQEDFNSIITRVAANQYKIADDITSLMLGNLSGGYLMSGALTGGDTWGYIETNDCVSLEFKAGAYINFENERGYLEVNTDKCTLKNVDIQGTGTVASAITQSFLLNANYVTFDNCKCSNRLSNVVISGFKGSGTILHNITSKYINCSAYSLDSSSHIYGFHLCKNLQNCLAYDINSSGGAVNAVGFYLSENLNNCYAYQIDCANNTAFGFSGCYQNSNCVAEDIDGDDAYGFYQCYRMSVCYANDIDSTSGNAFGFYQCNRLASCEANDIDSSGGTAYGFYDCNYGAALYTNEANNASNDWIDSGDAQITNQYSCPNVWT